MREIAFSLSAKLGSKMLKIPSIKTNVRQQRNPNGGLTEQSFWLTLSVEVGSMTRKIQIESGMAFTTSVRPSSKDIVILWLAKKGIHQAAQSLVRSLFPYPVQQVIYITLRSTLRDFDIQIKWIEGNRNDSRYQIMTLLQYLPSLVDNLCCYGHVGLHTRREVETCTDPLLPLWYTHTQTPQRQRLHCSQIYMYKIFRTRFTFLLNIEVCRLMQCNSTHYVNGTQCDTSVLTLNTV